MKQSQFVECNEALWQSLENWLDQQQLSKGERKQLAKKAEAQQRIGDATTNSHETISPPGMKVANADFHSNDTPEQKTITIAPEPDDFPADYRKVCHHLALAQSRMYSPLLIERLNQLVIRGHHQLYATRMYFWHDIANFFLRGFPQLVRQEWKVVCLASLMFFGTLFAMIIAIQIEPELIFSVVSGEQVAMMEQMYSPEQQSRIGRERAADSDVMMFGFYIRNNTGIGFQTFAGGLLYGLGTLFFLLYNGIVLGGIAGHLTHIGYIETFWGFVSGHAAFELTAIALSGAAGFKLAEALIMPGQKSRRLALLDNSKIAIKIVYGAATLFLMAAFVEAFWSSQAIIPAQVKYVVGIVLWILTLGYLLCAGRGSNA